MNLQRIFLVVLTVSTFTKPHIQPRAVLRASAAFKTKLHLLKAQSDINWLVKKFIAGIQCTKTQAASLLRMCKMEKNPFAELNEEDGKALLKAVMISACDVLSDSKTIDVLVSNIKNADKFVRRCKKETIKRNPAVKADLQADAAFFRNTIALLEQRKNKLAALFKAKAQELRTRTNDNFLDVLNDAMVELLALIPEAHSDKWLHYFQMADPCKNCLARFTVVNQAAKEFYLKVFKTAAKALAKKTR